MANTPVSATIPTVVFTPSTSGMPHAVLFNNGPAPVYLGGSGVSTSVGFALAPNDRLDLSYNGGTIWAISGYQTTSPQGTVITAATALGGTPSPMRRDVVHGRDVDRDRGRHAAAGDRTGERQQRWFGVHERAADVLAWDGFDVLADHGCAVTDPFVGYRRDLMISMSQVSVDGYGGDAPRDRAAGPASMVVTNTGGTVTLYVGEGATQPGTAPSLTSSGFPGAGGVIVPFGQFATSAGTHLWGQASSGTITAGLIISTGT